MAVGDKGAEEGEGNTLKEAWPRRKYVEKSGRARAALTTAAAGAARRPAAVLPGMR